MADHAPEILVEDAELLFGGTYSRLGFDLVITGADGTELVIADYFSFHPPPTLVLSEGIGMTPEMVAAFLHVPFDGALFAGPAGGTAPGEEIGKVTLLFGKVLRTSKTTGLQTELKDDDKLYEGDTLEIGKRGYLRAEMADGTKFTLGKNSKASLTDYSYDPIAEKGEFKAFVSKGSFRFKSGKIGEFAGKRYDHSTISTPSATIGIRGSELEGTVDPDSGETIVIHTSGILTISDNVGNNPVTLEVTGNTAVIVLGGNPQFTPQASGEQQIMVQDGLQPPAGDDDAGEDDSGADTGNEGEDDASTGEDATNDAEEGGSEEGSSEEAAAGDEDAEDAENDEAEQEDDTSEEDSADDGSSDEGSDEGSDDSSNENSSDQPTNNPADPINSFAEGIDEGETGSDGGDQGPSDAPPPIDAPPPTDVPAVELPPPDNAPVAADDSVEINEGESEDIAGDILGNDTDQDSDSEIRITAVNTANTLGTVTFDAQEQSLIYTADGELSNALGQDETATDTFTYTIESGSLSDSATVTVTITGENDPPTANDDSYITTEDDILTVDASLGILANDIDPDANDTLTITDAVRLSDDDTPLVLEVDGGFNFLASSSIQLNALDEGETFTTRFSYQIEDSQGENAEATLSIIVQGRNDPPEPVDDTDNTDEGTSITISPLSNDTDPEGHNLSIVAVNVIGGGSATISTDGQTIDYITADDLAENEVRQEQIIYTVSDGSLTSEGTVTVEVTGINDPPIIVPNPIGSEPVIDASGGPVQLDVLSTIVDDSQSLVVTTLDSTNTLGNVFLGSVFYDPLGVFQFLNQGEFATDTFGFTVEDTQGLTSTGIFTVKIAGVADAPIVSAPIARTLTEDNGTITQDLTTNVTDPDTNDFLTIANLTTSGNTTGITIQGNNAIVDPNAYNFLGNSDVEVVTLTYDATDITGLSAQQTATITINGVNDAPEALPIVSNATENDAIFTIDPLQTATDAEGDILSTTNVVILSGNTVGVTATADQLTVDPSAYIFLNAGETETISYQYDIIDGNGGVVQNTININIAGLNSVPASADNTITMSEDTNYVFSLSDFAFSDADLGQQLQSIRIIDPATVGNLTLNGTTVGSGQFVAASDLASGQLVFTPGPDENGFGYDSFAFVVSDGIAESPISAMTIDVEGVNDAPVAIDDNYATLLDTTLTTTIGVDDLLLNDSDVDLDVLSVDITPLANVANGSLALTANGTFTYTPTIGFTGTDTFTYRVLDGQGGTSTATATITISSASGVFTGIVSGDFNVPSIWDLGTVPTSIDTIDVASGITVSQLAGNNTVDAINLINNGGQLSITGGTLTAATTTVGSGTSLVVDGGTLDSASTINAGNLSLTDGSITSLLLQNLSQFDISGSTATITGQFDNLASGLTNLGGFSPSTPTQITVIADISNSGVIELEGGSVTAGDQGTELIIAVGRILTNLSVGTITIVSGADSRTITGTVDNQGTIDLNRSLTLNGVTTSSGNINLENVTLTVAAGGTLTNTGFINALNGNNFLAGTIDNTASGNISVDATGFTTGSLTIDNGFNSAGTIILDQTTVNDRGSLLTITAGTLTNSGTIVSNDSFGGFVTAFNEIDGSLTNVGLMDVNADLLLDLSGPDVFDTTNGTIDIAAGVTLRILGSNSTTVFGSGTTLLPSTGAILFDQTENLNIASAFTIDAAGPQIVLSDPFSRITVGGPGPLTLGAGATLELTNDDIATTTFTNLGNLRVVGGGGSNILTGVTFSNQSLLSIEGRGNDNAGLTIADDLTNTAAGTITIDTASTTSATRISTLTTNGGFIINQGLINTANTGGMGGDRRLNVDIVNTGTIAVTEDLSINMQANSTFDTSAGALSVAAGSTLTITGFNGVTTIGTGAITGGGTILFNQDGFLTIANPFTFTATSPVFDFGDRFNNITINGPAPLTLGTGGNLLLTDDSIGTPSFTNQGTLTIGEGGASDVLAGVVFSNEGNLRIEGSNTIDGSLTVADGFTNIATGAITLDTISTTTNNRFIRLNLTSGPLLNQGTINTANSGGMGGTREINGDVTNTGTINVNENLTLNSPVFDTSAAGSALNIAAGATLSVNSFNSTTTLGAGAVTGPGTLQFNTDANLNIASPFTITTTSPIFDFTDRFNTVTVSGPGALTLDASTSLILTQDVIGTPTFSNLGTLTIADGTSNILAGTAFTNNFVLNIEGSDAAGGDFTVADGFTNAATGVITIDTISTTGVRNLNFNLTTGPLQNLGILNTANTGGMGGLRTINGDITNTGTINVSQNLTLNSPIFDTSAAGSALNIAAGATLSINSFNSTTTLGAGAVTGPGTLQFNTDANLNIASPFTITSTSPIFDFTDRFNNITVSGPGALTLDAGINLILTDDNIGTSAFTNQGTLTVGEGTNSDILAGTTFSNEGSLRIEGTNTIDGALTVADGFTNVASGIITLDTVSTTANNRFVSLNLTTGPLINEGTLIIANTGGMGGTRTVNGDITNTATGVINVNENLTLNSPIFDTSAAGSALNIAAGATLTINSFGSITTLGAGAVAGPGTLQFNTDANLNIASPFTITTASPVFDFTDRFNNVTVNGPGALTLDTGASLTLTADNIGTPTFNNLGTLTIADGTSTILAGTAFTNNSILDIVGTDATGGDLTVVDGFINAATRVITIDTISTTGARNVSLNLTTGPLQNFGILNIENTGGMAGIRTINGDITNTGTINVNQNLTLNSPIFDTSAAGSALNIAAGATLTINSFGSITTLGAGAVAGPGTLQFNTDANISIVSPFTIAAASPVFDFTTRFNDVTVNGPGTLTLGTGANLILTDDDIGTPIFTNQGTLTIADGTSIILAGTAFTNEAILEVQGTDADDGAFTVADGFTNASTTGTINLDTISTTAGTRILTINVTTGPLLNQGTFNTLNSGGMGGTRRFNGDITNDTTGTININEDLTLNTQAFDLSAAGSSLFVAGGATLRITGAGGVTTFGNGAITGTGTILFNADETITIANPFSITSGGPQFDFSNNFDNITVNGPGPLTLDAGALLTLTQDTVNTTSFINSGILTIGEGTSSIGAAASFTNQGFLNVGSEGSIDFALTVANGFLNAAGATIDIDTASTVSPGRLSTLSVTTGAITNQGTITANDSGSQGGTRTINADITNGTTGTINVNEDLTINTQALDLSAAGSSLIVAAGKTLRIIGAGGVTTFGNGATSGTGTILFNADETITVSNPYTITASGPVFDFSDRFDTITVNGPGPLTLGTAAVLTLTDDTIATTSFTNVGDLTASEGIANFINGGFDNQGNLTVAGLGSESPRLTIANGFANSGTITIDSASTTFGDRTNSLFVTTGPISNQNVITTANTGGLGGIRVIDADITNTAGGSIIVTENLTVNTQAFDASLGTINVSAGAVLQITGMGGTTTFGSATTLLGTGTIQFADDLNLTIASAVNIAASGPTIDFSTKFDTVSIGGPGALTLEAGASFTLTDDTIAPGAFTNAGDVTVTAGAVNVINTLFDNQGSLTVGGVGTEAPILTINNGFDNSGVITIDTASTLVNGPNQTLTVTLGPINNLGTIGSANSGGLGGPKFLNADIINRGLIDVDEDLTLNAALVDSTRGTIVADSAATLRIIGSGILQLGAASTLVGGGRIFFNADDTITLVSDFALEATGPILDFGNSIDNITVNGPGTLLLEPGASLVLTADTINAPLGNNGTIQVAQSGSSTITSFFSNSGVLQVGGDDTFNAILNVQNGLSGILNAAPGVISIDTASTTQAGNTETLNLDPGGTITNQGIVEAINSGGLGGTRIINADFNNVGTINVIEDLTIQSQLFDTTTGRIVVAAGKTLTFTGPSAIISIDTNTILRGGGVISFADDLSINIAGSYEISGNGPAIDLGTATNNVSFIGAGQLTLGSDAILNLTNDNINVSSFTNNGILNVIEGTANNSNGSFTNNGNLNIAGNVNSSTTLTLANGLFNSLGGVVTLDTAAGITSTQTLFVTAGTLTNDGVIETANTGSGGTRVINANIVNPGDIILIESLNLNKTAGLYTNSGTITINAGRTLDIQGGGSTTLTNSLTGTIGGNGLGISTINLGTGVTLNQDGTLQPGGAGTFGTLTIVGSVNYGATANLLIDISDVANGDLLIVDSYSATGTLDLNFVPGYSVSTATPEVFNFIQITGSGAFGSYTVTSNLAAGYDITIPDIGSSTTTSVSVVTTPNFEKTFNDGGAGSGFTNANNFVEAAAPVGGDDVLVGLGFSTTNTVTANINSLSLEDSATFTNSGILNLASTSRTEVGTTFNLSGGTLLISQLLTNDGTFNWTGGSITDLPSQLINNGTLNVSADGSSFGGTIENRGTANINIATSLTGLGQYINNGVTTIKGTPTLVFDLLNEKNGILNIFADNTTSNTTTLTTDLMNDGLLVLDNIQVGVPQAAILNLQSFTNINKGTIRFLDSVGAGGGRGIFTVSGADLQNDGLIDVLADATIDISDSSLNTEFGAINVDLGKTLTLGNTANGTVIMSSNTDLTGSGTISFIGMQTLFLTDDVVIDGLNPTLDFQGDVTITTNTGSGTTTVVLTIDDTGSLDLSDDPVTSIVALRNEGTLTLSGTVAQTIDGGFFNDKGALLTITGEGLKQFEGDFTNRGTIDLDLSSGISNRLEINSLGSLGTLTNEGTINAVDTNILGGTRVISANLINDGGVVNVGSDLILDGILQDGLHQNFGTINIAVAQTLSLGVGDALTNNGVITGAGILDVSVSGAPVPFLNDGILDPSDPLNALFGTGVLTIDGDTQFDRSSEVRIEIGGTASGTEYDVLSSSGTFTLDGRLRVMFNAFAPTAGNSFTVLAAVSILGAFDAIAGTDFDTSVVLDVVQNATQINLVAVNVDIAGTVGDDILTATATTNEFLAGGDGDDDFVDISTGDTAFGQAGDDFFTVNTVDNPALLGFKRIDGGDGIDELFIPKSLDYTAGAQPTYQIDNIEILSLKDGIGTDVISLDIASIRQIVDGFNELTGIEDSLVIKGDVGDQVNLIGNFNIDRPMFIDATESGGTPFDVVTDSDAGVSLVVDQSVRLDVARGDGSVLILGSGGGDTLSNTALGDYLDGRGGSDTVNGGAGDDTLVDDRTDAIINGNTGLDTLLIGESIDLTNIGVGANNLKGVEILDLTNGYANDLTLNIADVLDIVVDNALDAVVTPSLGGVPTLLVRADDMDTLTLDGQDLSNVPGSTTGTPGGGFPANLTSTFLPFDALGDGDSYVLFINTGSTAQLLVDVTLIDPALLPVM